jgi:hypothetical protein
MVSFLVRGIGDWRFLLLCVGDEPEKIYVLGTYLTVYVKYDVIKILNTNMCQINTVVDKIK